MWQKDNGIVTCTFQEDVGFFENEKRDTSFLLIPCMLVT